jgi:AcrR family transcriptional regulator
MEQPAPQISGFPRRTERGERSRAAILEAAARLATVEGLEGLSIGRLAESLGVSKSGLYAHFRSKEELQLAAIETAVQIYTREIVDPALELPPGRERLLQMCERYFDFIASGLFPGGCFFVYTSVDPVLNRPAVHARLAQEQRDWLGLIEEMVRDALDRGELPAGTDPTQLAFEVDAVLIGADANFVLLRDRGYLDRGRSAIRRLLGLGRPGG